jgi:hypothetical protein
MESFLHKICTSPRKAPAFIYELNLRYATWDKLCVDKTCVTQQFLNEEFLRKLEATRTNDYAGCKVVRTAHSLFCLGFRKEQPSLAQSAIL